MDSRFGTDEERRTQIPAVSVVLAVYNGQRFLSRTLDSVLRQTYRNFELLAVDDGSTDGSLCILEQYASSDERVRILRQPNGGVARARNRAIQESRGDFIAPIDADDLWQPSKLELQMQRMAEAGEGTGLVYGSWVCIDSEDHVIDRSPHWAIEGAAFEALLQINFTGNASVPLFRKSCVVGAGGYNESMAAHGAGGCEDWELALRIASRHKIAALPQVLLGYRRHAGSMSTAQDTMRRSMLVMQQTVRRIRPEVDPRLLRASSDQFSLYLAGCSFWSGDLWGAVSWALRSGLRLLFCVAPHVLRILLRRLAPSPPRPKMVPGWSLRPQDIPRPLLPYHLLYLPHAARSRSADRYSLPMSLGGERSRKVIEKPAVSILLRKERL